MISKVLSVSRVGNFVSYASKGNNLDFRKLTLIYAENGSGKTTLSSIFRSLQTGEPAHIVSRKTLSQDGDVAVAILLNGSHKAEFKKGRWSEHFPHIEIFDAHFVNNNVFSGHLVEHEHKKSLYHFVIGEDGLKLTTEFNALAVQHRESTGTVSEAENKAQACIGGPMDLKDFIKLKPIANIDTAITDKDRQIDSLKKVDDLKRKDAPAAITLPSVVLADVSALLGKRMEDISTAAEAQVQAHIQAHLGDGGETWLAQGVGYLKDDNCPFCREPLSGSELIKHYQGYFSDAYTTLKEEITAFGAAVARTFDKAAKLIPLTRLLTTNEALLDFWAEHLAFERPADLSPAIEVHWNALSDLLQAQVKQKLAAPLEPAMVSDDLLLAITQWEALVKEVADYNALVQALAFAVAEKKRELGEIDLQTAQAELRRLVITKRRFEPAAIDACKAYEAAVEARKALDKQKKEAKDKLDTYTAEVFGKYQSRINEHLAGFGARFKITAVDTSYAGGKPSSTYALEINGQAISLGNVRENPNSPCFGNTLSEGDKSTLAFAFFLARLDLDPYLAEKVVVIDDPISSLDTNRKNKTQQQISRLIGQVKQVVLQSHDPYFLKLVYDDRRGADCRLLTIARRPDGSFLEEWEIEHDTRSDYLKHFYVLKTFIEEGPNGNLENVASCLRKYVEGNLRYRYPDHFGPSEWLGSYVEKVRAVTDDAHDLWRLRPYLDDLSDITSYSSPSHHAGSPRTVTAGELRVYVQRALAFGKSA